MLKNRNWYVLYVTPNISNRLVTSDRAIILTWKEDIFQNWPPGYGIPNTRVWFPVTDSTLLMGKFETLPSVSSRLANRFIRLHNTLQMSFSERFIFSGVKSFPIAPPANESSTALQNEMQKAEERENNECNVRSLQTTIVC